jgi:DNA-directed RNA polymerase subunit RPC12/RpoP
MRVEETKELVERTTTWYICEECGERFTRGFDCIKHEEDHKCRHEYTKYRYEKSYIVKDCLHCNRELDRVIKLEDELSQMTLEMKERENREDY